MHYHKTQPHALLVIILIVVSLLAAVLPDRVEAVDAGVARRTGGIAEIELVSAVAGSRVVRSLASQEGAPGTIRILDVTTNVVLGTLPLSNPDGQYAVTLQAPLVLGQRIQAFNFTKGYYSASVVVTLARPPVIKEPVLPSAAQITGYGTPGSKIEIRNAVTNVVLGTGTVPPAPSNGTFTVALVPSPLRLFHTIRAIDATKVLTGKNVSILNLLTAHVSQNLSCGISSTLIPGFTKTTFACALPRPRGVMLDGSGNPLVVAGSAPLDRAYSLMPAGFFRLVPTTGQLSLFSPVSGVAVKRGEGAFGTDMFIARPRGFYVRGQVFVQPGDGEIFRVSPGTATVPAGTISVFTRALDFAPTGMAFAPQGSPFLNNLFVTDLFGAGVRRIGPTGAISTLVNLPNLQGLAFSPGGATTLYVTQPSRGQIWRVSPSGGATPFAAGMISPMGIAFGPGGAPFGFDLYVADAGNGVIWRINSAGVKTPFATGLGAPFGLVFKATTPQALFITDYLSGNIIRFTPNS